MKIKTCLAILTIALGCTMLASCNQQKEAPKDMTDLLTAHKWQLIEESGLNLPKKSLRDNIIELKNDGGLVYYENTENPHNIFLENTWVLSDDRKKIIETLPDESQLETEIVEVTDNTLRLRYFEANHEGEYMPVEETYQKFTN